MKLEAGKRYVMRNGLITGALIKVSSKNYPFFCKVHDKCWKEDGSFMDLGVHDPEDIVGEYAEHYAPNEAPQLTMRDQFAMAALTGLIARAGEYASTDAFVSSAYKFADAMMKAREK